MKGSRQEAAGKGGPVLAQSQRNLFDRATVNESQLLSPFVRCCPEAGEGAKGAKSKDSVRHLPLSTASRKYCPLHWGRLFSPPIKDLQFFIINSSQLLRDHIGHVQISQVPLRDSPLNEGELNHDYILGKISTIYDDFIGLEYYSKIEDLFQLELTFYFSPLQIMSMTALNGFASIRQTKHKLKIPIEKPVYCWQSHLSPPIIIVYILFFYDISNSPKWYFDHFRTGFMWLSSCAICWYWINFNFSLFSPESDAKKKSTG